MASAQVGRTLRDHAWRLRRLGAESFEFALDLVTIRHLERNVLALLGTLDHV